MGAHGQGAGATDGRWLTTVRTLSFILNGDDVLLMKRAAYKRIFPNRYNGVGGHVERGEDVLTSAIREMTEETGLAVRDPRLCAIHIIDAGEQTGITLFIFTAWADSRSVTACDEGTLHWLSRSQATMLPADEVVEDLPLILPRILTLPAGAPPLYAHVDYDATDTIRIRTAGDQGYTL